MPDEDYSRRTLLKTLPAAGVLGAAFGGMTGAYFADRSSFRGSQFGTGAFELELATTGPHDSAVTTGFPDDDDFTTSSTIPIELSSLEPGDTGFFACAARVCDESSRLWFRPVVTPRSTTLAHHLDVRFIHRPNCDDDATDDYGGTLAELVDNLADGLQLGVDCGDCAPACVDIDWQLNEEISDDMSGESLRLDLEFVAVQCRHLGDPISPWS